MHKSELQNHVDKLIKRHGGLRAAARATGIDPAYMWRLQQGIAPGTSDKILRKLGLQRTETLRPM